GFYRREKEPYLSSWQSPLGERGHDMRRNGFTPADGVNALIGFRFEVNFLCWYAECFRECFAHFRKMRPELRLLRDHDSVDVFDGKVFFVQELLRMLKEEQAVGAFPPRVRVRKMRSDVAQTGSAQ